ncbi:MBL fold metallo-hydrolase [Helicobacter muridarum]|uniref:Hydroxyacylglutathione hydrolase n=2 Tax=Helicobacter muridarum TaxID=216 RepID=A0A377PUP0_9HELI|nr:MBL fold metallo-hydrolase [Helicobacter muridarum]STQ86124.1 hydroxyacylglutathione hydrolase [Helicobacter muridarum]
MKNIFSLVLYIACFVNTAFANGFYHTNIADTEVFIISLQKSNPPVAKLITKDVSIKNQEYPQNEHNIMLIKQDGVIALIDTGFQHTIETLRQKLSEQDVKFEDITHILITHGHKDHLGGILNKDGKTNFPNATLIIDKNEYDFWTKSKDEFAKKSLQSFGKNIKFLESNKSIFDSKAIIKPIPAYGHTPGHTLYSIEDDKRKIVFLGDIIHVYDVQMKCPKIAIEYDINKKEAVKTRLRLFKELKGVEVIGVHMPFSKPIVFKQKIKTLH